VPFLKIHQLLSILTAVGRFLDQALCSWRIFRISTSQLVDFDLVGSKFNIVNVTQIEAIVSWHVLSQAFPEVKGASRLYHSFNQKLFAGTAKHQLPWQQCQKKLRWNQPHPANNYWFRFKTWSTSFSNLLQQC